MLDQGKPVSLRRISRAMSGALYETYQLTQEASLNANRFVLCRKCSEVCYPRCKRCRERYDKRYNEDVVFVQSKFETKWKQAQIDFDALKCEARERQAHKAPVKHRSCVYEAGDDDSMSPADMRARSLAAFHTHLRNLDAHFHRNVKIKRGAEVRGQRIVKPANTQTIMKHHNRLMMVLKDLQSKWRVYFGTSFRQCELPDDLTSHMWEMDQQLENMWQVVTDRARDMSYIPLVKELEIHARAYFSALLFESDKPLLDAHPAEWMSLTAIKYKDQEVYEPTIPVRQPAPEYDGMLGYDQYAAAGPPEEERQPESYHWIQTFHMHYDFDANDARHYQQIATHVNNLRDRLGPWTDDSHAARALLRILAPVFLLDRLSRSIIREQGYIVALNPWQWPEAGSVRNVLFDEIRYINYFLEILLGRESQQEMRGYLYAARMAMSALRDEVLEYTYEDLVLPVRRCRRLPSPASAVVEHFAEAFARAEALPEPHPLPARAPVIEVPNAVEELTTWYFSLGRWYRARMDMDTFEEIEDPDHEELMRLGRVRHCPPGVLPDSEEYWTFFRGRRAPVRMVYDAEEECERDPSLAAVAHKMVGLLEDIRKIKPVNQRAKEQQMLTMKALFAARSTVDGFISLQLNVPPSVMGEVRSAVCEEMDSVKDAAISILGGSVIGNRMVNAIGQVREGAGQDNPNVLNMSEANLATVDVAERVQSLAFKTEDRCGDHRRNFSEKKVDIHDIKHRCKIESMWTATIWTTSQTAGTELLHLGRTSLGYASTSQNVVCPYAPFEIGTSSSGEITHTAPSFYSQFFHFWRGSITYVVEVINTKFHQGQLFLTYQPVSRQNAGNPSVAQARNCMGAVIDLSMCNKTELTIPYNADSDYLFIPEGAAEIARGLQGISNTYPSGMGILQLFVMNQLTAPSAVSTSVDVNVWVRMNDDFEMHVPRPLFDEVRYKAGWITEPREVGIVEEMEREGEPELVEKTMGAPAPTALPTTGISPATNQEVSIDVNVRRADFSRVVSKEYPLATGINWTTSQVRGTRVYNSRIVDLFVQEQLAYYGLLTYHDYMRMEFEITLKMNPNPMFAGLLAMWIIPPSLATGDAQMASAIASMKQYIVAYYTPQTDTSVTVRIPWQSFRRVMYTSENDSVSSPEVRLTVISQLRTGSGGSTQLHGMLVGRIHNPYIGFKRALITASTEEIRGWDGAEDEDVEMPPDTGLDEVVENSVLKRDTEWEATSDSTQKTACGGAPLKALGPPRRGYMQGKHMHVLHLMRRPNWIGGLKVPPEDADDAHKIGVVPVKVLGATHRALMSTYRHYSGSHRITVTNNLGRSANCLLGATYVPTEYIQEPEFVHSTAPWHPSQDFHGTVYVQAGEQPAHVFQIPQYHYIANIMRNTPDQPDSHVQQRPDYNSCGTVRFKVQFQTGSSIPHGVFNFYHHVGDDFRFYLPMVMPRMRKRTAPTEEEEPDPEAVQPGPLGDTLPREYKVPGKPPRFSIPQIFRKKEVKIVEEGWIRDLTQEGVEPNPGPYDLNAMTPEEESSVDMSYEQVEEELDRAFEEYWREKVEELGVFEIGGRMLTAVRDIVGGIYERFKRVINNQVGASVARRAYQFLVDRVLPVMVWCMDFVLNLQVILTSSSRLAIGTAMASLTAKCVMAHDYGRAFLEQLTEGTAPIHEEIEGDEEEKMSLHAKIAIGAATALVASLVGVMGYHFSSRNADNVRKLATWKMGEAMSTLSKVNSGTKAMPELWQTTRTAIESAIAYFVEGDAMYADWYKRRKTFLAKWCKTWDTLSTANAFDQNNLFQPCRQEGQAHRSNYEVLADLAKVAMEIRTYSGDVKGFPVTWNQTAVKVLTAFSRAQKAYDNLNQRVEPIGLWVEGNAGCGKSFLWTSIAPFVLMKRCGLVKTYAEAKRQVWAKPSDPEHVYFDNYASQHYVIADDFAATTDDHDVAQMINLISVASCPLNCADLTEKKTIFDSKFVCVTTNQSSVRGLDKLRVKEAMIRRFPFALTMRPKPDFMLADTTRVNLPKFQELLEHKSTVDELISAVDEAWEFRRVKLDSGRPDSVITFRRIVQDVESCYRLKKSVEKAFDDLLGAIRDDIVENYVVGATIKEEMGPELDYFDALAAYESLEDDIYSSPPTGQAARPMDSAVQLATWNFHLRDIQRRVREEEFDYSDSRRYLDRLREHVSDLGWSDWDSFYATVMESPPVSPLECGEIVSYAEFAGLIRWVTAIKPEVCSRSRFDWKGLMIALTALAGATAGFGVIYMVYKLVKLYLTNVIEATEEGPAYDNSRRQPIRKGPTGRAPTYHAKLAKVEGGVPTEYAIRIQKNLRKIVIRDPKGEKQDMGLYALFIDNSTFLIPHHFVERYVARRERGYIISVEVLDRKGQHLDWMPITVSPVNYEPIKMHDWLEGPRDLLVVKLLGHVMPHARNIRAMIMCNRDRKRFFDSELAAHWMCYGDGYCRSVVSYKTAVCFRNRYGIGAVTEVESTAGDCGRPYIMMNRSVPRPLIGLHVWAVDHKKHETGIADFSLEAIEQAEHFIKSRLDQHHDEVSLPILEEIGEIHDDVCRWWNSSMEFVGRMEVNNVLVQRHDTDRTGFERTGLNHDDWFNEYEISAKGVVEIGDDKIHTLFTNVQKYTPKSAIHIPCTWHWNAVTYMGNRVDRHNGELLNWDETLNGGDGLNPIVLSTSPGYWSKWFQDGKEELIEVNEMVDGSHHYRFSQRAKWEVIPLWRRSFCDHLHHCEKQLQAGEVIDTFWSATNKDELLERRKVRIGKTRVFVQPGFEYTLLMRRYFGDFIRWYKSHPGFRLSHAIGIDKEAVWSDVYRKLKEVGDRGFDVDYSNYDGTVHPMAVDAFLRMVDKFYDYRWSLERRALIHSMIYSPMIVGPYIALTIQGNRSGNPATDVFNSITNWYIQLVAMEGASLLAGRPCSLFDDFERVRCLTYGDDVVTSVPDDFLPWYNRKVVAEVLQSFGYEVTAANKTAELTESDPVEMLTFLKSPFVECDGVVMAPLPMKVIHRELQWGYKRNAGDMTVLKMKVDMALAMMVHHGKEEFQKLVVQLSDLGWDVGDDYVARLSKIVDKQEIATVEGVNGEAKWFSILDLNDELCMISGPLLPELGVLDSVFAQEEESSSLSKSME